MTSQQHSDAPQQRARSAMASYLRLLAACLEDEADMIENDPQRSDEVLRRFREGVLAMSLEDAPIDALLDRMMPKQSAQAHADEAPMLLPGTPAPARPSTRSRGRAAR
jgi:hypothetical protein